MIGCVGVSSNGSSGGLTMLWKEGTNLQLLSFFKNHIDIAVEEELDKDNWRITGFYGELDIQNRNESWELLKRLASHNNRGWVCIGDFNEIFWDHEKARGIIRRETQMVNFINALDETR